MNLKIALSNASNDLSRAGISTSKLDARVLLLNAIKEDEVFLLKNPLLALSTNQYSKFRRYIKRRKSGEPVAYITGHKEFYGLDFKVNKNVLIPRPETEILVEEVINYVKNREQAPQTILDIGTGSGCIAIALKKNLPESQIFASDISDKALRIARINSKQNHTKVRFYNSDLLQSMKNKKIYIIAANLPYVKTQILEENKEIGHEPHKALAGGKDGLDIYRDFFKQLCSLKIKPKMIICEINLEQKSNLSGMAKECFPSARTESSDLKSNFRFTCKGVSILKIQL